MRRLGGSGATVRCISHDFALPDRSPGEALRGGSRRPHKAAESAVEIVAEGETPALKALGKKPGLAQHVSGLPEV